jgi:hypothetical protein
MDASLTSGSGPDNRPVYAPNGEWVAFITAENLVFTPQLQIIGHVVGDDLFTMSGTYVATIEQGALVRYDDRSALERPRASQPVEFPGYPGVPAGAAIRPLKMQDDLTLRGTAAG